MGTFSTRAKWRTLSRACCSVFEKCLTPPTLLERRSFGKFDERYRFSTWMYRIALNVAISFYRRENRRTRYVISDEEHLLEAIDETKNQPEEIRLLYEFIEGLDPLNKALVLLYLDGNNYQEIAEVLGISETNVATKISRLKSKMKQEFRETGQTESQAKSRNET